MTRYTQKQLREMVEIGIATDISNGDNGTRDELIREEGALDHVGYAESVYGCGGLLLKGRNSGKLYAVTSRTSAIFVFG